MGQRLNIEFYVNNKAIVNCYYHWSGFSDSAMEETRCLIHHLQDYDFSNIPENEIKFIVIRTLEDFGARLKDKDLEEAKKLYPERKFSNDDMDRNEGLIGITKESMDNTRSWEEARVNIFLTRRRFEIEGIFCYSDEEEIKDFYDHTEEEVETFKQNLFKIPTEEIEFERVDEIENYVNNMNHIEYDKDNDEFVHKIG